MSIALERRLRVMEQGRTRPGEVCPDCGNVAGVPSGPSEEERRRRDPLRFYLECGRCGGTLTIRITEAWKTP